MGKRGRSYFFKILILIFPWVAILAVYFITDPFKVLRFHRFDNYYDAQPWQINREVAGLGNLQERLRSNDIPNSFILGNSQSLVYHTDIWETYLKDSSKPYQFDASQESLMGVWGKVKFLDRNNIKIKNVLLVCDSNLLSKTENVFDPPHIKHPAISGESMITFQATFIKAYFTDFFFVKHIDYLISGHLKKYMLDIFSEKGYVTTEWHGNNIYYKSWDSMLKKDSIGYYSSRPVFKSQRSATQENRQPVIKEAQLIMLKEIKGIFDKHHTSYKIVISPAYDQKKLNGKDLKYLTDIFGKDMVYDYSAKSELNESAANFYDSYHYKANVAQKIMTDIYSK